MFLFRTVVLKLGGVEPLQGGWNEHDLCSDVKNKRGGGITFFWRLMGSMTEKVAQEKITTCRLSFIVFKTV